MRVRDKLLHSYAHDIITAICKNHSSEAKIEIYDIVIELGKSLMFFDILAPLSHLKSLIAFSSAWSLPWSTIKYLLMLQSNWLSSSYMNKIFLVSMIYWTVLNSLNRHSGLPGLLIFSLFWSWSSSVPIFAKS